MYVNNIYNIRKRIYFIKELKGDKDGRINIVFQISQTFKFVRK